MASEELHPRTAPAASSRREFLKEAATLGMAAPMLGRMHQKGFNMADDVVVAYVGTYSAPQGPEGSPGRGEGIYLFDVNPKSGDLSPRAVVPNKSNPSYLALHPSGEYLYSGDEMDTFQGKHSGSVTAYRIDRNSRMLKPLNTVSSEGAGPAYVSVHPSGKYVLVANYAGATLAVIEIKSGGSLGAATCVKHDEGKPGPTKATSAPPGSFAISGHDAPHVHMVHADPSGRYVISTDLGMDKIFVWKFDERNGVVTPNQTVSLPPGDGPRHFAFHPNGRWMYSLQEEASTLVLFDYDGSRGLLTQKQMISSLPPGFAGTNFGAGIKLSADGSFVYASNRLHDSIACFAVGQDGHLAFSSEAWTRGDYPRSFGIEPSGNFLYSCNQRADAITAFRINRETGGLEFTGRYTPVGTPAVIVFAS